MLSSWKDCASSADEDRVVGATGNDVILLLPKIYFKKDSDSKPGTLKCLMLSEKKAQDGKNKKWPKK